MSVDPSVQISNLFMEDLMRIHNVKIPLIID
jgi:hypothetical protein